MYRVLKEVHFHHVTSEQRLRKIREQRCEYFLKGCSKQRAQPASGTGSEYAVLWDQKGANVPREEGRG